jgi:hypothetical protein
MELWINAQVVSATPFITAIWGKQVRLMFDQVSAEQFGSHRSGLLESARDAKVCHYK